MNRNQLLEKTHYGLVIYAHILRSYYPNEIVIDMKQEKCQPTKNPFNNHNTTLCIDRVQGVFRYSDCEKHNFSGDPFDFAKLHYNIEGEALLQKINEDLHLHIDEEFSIYNKRVGESAIQNIELLQNKTQSKMSLYKAPISNVSPWGTVSIRETYDLIRSNRYKKKTQQLRAIESKKDARTFKAANFEYLTFSGTFSKRNDKALIQHSGLLVIDFDHIPDLKQLKSRLLHDECFDTELLFVSPSGDGLKWVISIDLSKATHTQFFNAVYNYIKATYKIDIDKSGKDISRACFLCFDPEVYINPKFTIHSK